MKQNSSITNVEDVYVISYGHEDLPIGRIKQDTLYLDSPSRHQASQAYGLDVSVLTEDNSMDYHYIIIRERNKDWTTSRKFWLKHGNVKDLNNGRNETFLPDKLFGAEKVELYEQWSTPEVQKLLSQEIFDVFENAKNWEALSKWELAMELDEEYHNSLKYQRKITL